MTNIVMADGGRIIATTHAQDQSYSIPYRPQYTRITGKVAASILLQQISYWWHIKGGKPFYKFRAPCGHDWYKEGDSWTEELGMTAGGFDTALKAISAKVTKGKSKSELLKVNLVIYWTDADRVTWYQLNEKLFYEMVYLAYNEPELLGKSGFRNQLDKHGNVIYPSSETTSETTRHGADAPPAPADAETKHTVIETQPDGRERVVERTACKACYRPIVPADEVYPGLSYCKCNQAAVPADAIAEPPVYHCKNCQNEATVNTNDSMQGYVSCTSCGESYFINEKPVTKWDIEMMQYLGWDCPDRPDVDANLAPARKFNRQCKGCRIWGTHEEIDDGHLCYECSKTVCYECFKPTTTTPEMPHIAKVCTCQSEAALVEAFGPPPERQERKPPPHWHELVHDPRVLWGEHSDTFKELVREYGESGVKVKFLGYDWEQLTQLEPDWDDKAAIKSWSSGLWVCLKAAGGDASIVLEATRKAIEDGLTIADPYSVVKVTRALCAERKRDKGKDDGQPAPYSDAWYDKQMADNPQLEAFS